MCVWVFDHVSVRMGVGTYGPLVCVVREQAFKSDGCVLCTHVCVCHHTWRRCSCCLTKCALPSSFACLVCVCVCVCVWTGASHTHVHTYARILAIKHTHTHLEALQVALECGLERLLLSLQTRVRVRVRWSVCIRARDTHAQQDRQGTHAGTHTGTHTRTHTHTHTHAPPAAVWRRGIRPLWHEGPPSLTRSAPVGVRVYTCVCTCVCGHVWVWKGALAVQPISFCVSTCVSVCARTNSDRGAAAAPSWSHILLHKASIRS